MSDSDEVWKPVPNYEGYYEVSNKGRVRSVDREINAAYGSTRVARGRILSINHSGPPYPSVMLYKENEVEGRLVHHLVALAFLGEPSGPIGTSSGEYQVNHIDGDRKNNSVENLEWVTKAENDTHAVKNGLHCKGENVPNSKLTAEKVREARRMRRNKETGFSDLSDIFGVSEETMRQAVRGIKWSHIETPRPVRKEE